MPGNGATMAEVAQKIKSLKPQDKIHHLLKGAQAEGELVYYGTLPINEFLPLVRLFNSRLSFYRLTALLPLRSVQAPSFILRGRGGGTEVGG
jgi:hypothetical protein